MILNLTNKISLNCSPTWCHSDFKTGLSILQNVRDHCRIRNIGVDIGAEMQAQERGKLASNIFQFIGVMPSIVMVPNCAEQIA